MRTRRAGAVGGEQQQQGEEEEEEGDSRPIRGVLIISLLSSGDDVISR